MRKYNPANAMELLGSTHIAEFACDLVRNPAFSKADARTTDAHGMRVADHVSAPEDRQRWPEKLHALLGLPVEQFQEAMAQQPVRLSEIPKPNGGTREIVVPSFLRRCCSNAINDVLLKTSDRLLPACVRAYRPGEELAVQEAVLDVAEAVVDGRVRYFAKLDIKSYFSEMQWDSIETALRHYGYGEPFISRVMVTVRCPIVTRIRGKLIPVTTNKGAQMGLAESSTLANLVPWELDQVLARSKRLVYLRYSDDLFIGSSDRGEVVAAVREVAGWCRQHCLTLKGVEKNARLANLVSDVKRTKISFLGAEIDSAGYIHMPTSKLLSKLQELQYKKQRLALVQVSGVSRYGLGGGADVFDLEDLHAGMTSFLDYWGALDPRGTERARQVFKRRFPLTPGASASGPGTVWCARLWGHRTNSGAGTGPTVQHLRESSERERPMPFHRSKGPFGTSTTGGMAPGSSRRDFSQRERLKHSDDSPEPGPTSRTPDVALVTESHSVARDEGVSQVGIPILETPESHSMKRVASSMDADDRKVYRFLSPSFEEDLESETWLKDLGSIDLGSTDQESQEQDSERAVGDPAGGASPPPPVIANQFIYVDAVRATVGRDHVVLVGRCGVVDGLARSATVQVVRKCRPEAALVRQLIEETVGARGRTVTLAMEHPWLAKSVLQPGRRFHAPLLYSRVLELHEAARGREVSVVGGHKIPALLLREMDRVLDGLVRAAAAPPRRASREIGTVLLPPTAA